MRTVRLDAAEKVSGKVEKEAQMFEPKASGRASHLVTHFFGNPKDSGLAVAFFAYFSWRDKKSEWPPGHPWLVSTKRKLQGPTARAVPAHPTA
jgi:hypothetical protein